MRLWLGLFVAVGSVPVVPECPLPAPHQEGTENSSERSWIVIGRVVDATTGKPLEGVRGNVLLKKVPYAWMIPGGFAARTDADGRFGGQVRFAGTHVVCAMEAELPNGGYLGRGRSAPSRGQVYREVLVG